MTGSAMRALARLARRDIARHRLRSLLVVVLVLLPVAAMVAGIALYRTTSPSQEREDTARMGRADLIASGTTRAALLGRVPAGSQIESVTMTDGRIVLPGARVGLALASLDLDGLAAGMLTVTNGVAPSGSDQVAISDSVGKLAGVGIGGQIELEGLGRMTVVGMIENPLSLGQRVAVVDPAAFPLGDELSATWLIGLPPGVDPGTVADANIVDQGSADTVLIQSRQSSRPGGIAGDSASPSILIVGSLALVEAALIASAAFAVSIRRRQRELGLIAANGATPRQLAASVFLGAAMLGLIACLGGIVVGLAGALATTPWLDQLTQHRNPPLVVDGLGLVAPVAIGLAAALIAAVVPARTVARMPVLLALSGRRPPQASARRTLVLGLVVVALAAAMTVAGATSRDLGDASTFLLIGGAVLSTLGFGACAPWLLERLEPIAARLPLAGRLAFRDTARGRSRTSPIVTAILASFAAAVALGAFQASRDAESARGWMPVVYSDELLLQGAGAASAANALSHDTGVQRALAITQLVPKDASASYMYDLADGRDAAGHLVNLLEQCGNCNPGAFEPWPVSAISPATPDLLALAHAAGAEADLRAGRAVVLSPRVASASALRIRVFGDPSSSEPTGTFTVPVRVILAQAFGQVPEAFLPDATIRQLGLVPGGEGGEFFGNVVVQYDHPVAAGDVAHAQEVAAQFPDTYSYVDEPPGRAGQGFRLLITALVLLFAVSVTGIAIALGEAESRPEQRSLLAIGADPRLRRRIAGARAAVLALLAGILAVPAGLLPMWGIFVSRGSPLVVPSLEIAGAVLLLPVLAVLSSWLLSRPIPDWNAFRNVRPGE